MRLKQRKVLIYDIILDLLNKLFQFKASIRLRVGTEFEI